MPNKYTENETKEEVRQLLKDLPNSFYQKGVFKRAGTTNGSGRLYMDVVSEELISNYKCVERIGQDINSRKENFKLSSHDGSADVTKRGGKALMFDEKLFARALFNSHKTDAYYGTIVDYETPLKAKMSKLSGIIGKIDLIAKDDNNKSIKLLELKIGTNKETVLRAILEIYTYYKLVCNARDQFLKDFSAISYKIQVGIITDKDSKSGENIKHINQHPELYPKLKELIGKMSAEIGGFEFFTYDYPKSGEPFCDPISDDGKKKQITPRLIGDITIKKVNLL